MLKEDRLSVLIDVGRPGLAVGGTNRLGRRSWTAQAEERSGGADPQNARSRCSPTFHGRDSGISCLHPLLLCLPCLDELYPRTLSPFAS